MRHLMLFAAAALIAAALPFPAHSGQWEGFYIGGQAGAGWGDRTGCWGLDPDCDGGTFGIEVDGLLVGAKTGYNLPTGSNLVLALDVEGSFSSMEGDTVVSDYSADGEYAYLATAGGRLGYQFGDLFMGFVELGGAITGYDSNDSTGCHFSQTRHGIYYGLGAEFAVTPRGRLGAEYNYIDLGTERQSCFSFASFPIVNEAEDELNTIMISFTWLIGQP